MLFFNGHPDNEPFMVAVSETGYSWQTIHTSRGTYAPYQWGRIAFPSNTVARYVEFRPFGTSGLQFYEIGFRNNYGDLIPIARFRRGSEGAYRLFDEQHLVPVHPHFMLGIYFDEAHHVRTAHDYVHGNPATEWTHPPMGKNFIATGIAIGGMNPWAWRLPGALFGVGMVLLLFALARQMFNSNEWGLFASTIFAFDFMRFTQTRIATLDTYVTFFIIAMYLFMFMYIQGVKTRSFWKSAGLLFLCGISVGLAIASKWQGVYALIGLPILFFPVWYRMLKEDVKLAIKTVFICIGAFIITPFIVYALSYIPFVIGAGAESFGNAVRIFWRNQVDMLTFHSGVISYHPYGSPWWEWPLMLTPFHYYARIINGYRISIVAFENPAIWWFGIPVFLFALYRIIRPRIEVVVKTKAQLKRERKEAKKQPNTEAEAGGMKFSPPLLLRNYNMIFILIAYLAQYLPWVFVPRETYIYHYFPSVPFVVLLITWFFKEEVRKPWIAVIYVLIVIGLFAMAYPVLSGMPFRIDGGIVRWILHLPNVNWG